MIKNGISLAEYRAISSRAIIIIVTYYYYYYVKFSPSPNKQILKFYGVPSPESLKYVHRYTHPCSWLIHSSSWE